MVKDGTHSVYDDLTLQQDEDEATKLAAAN
jgi:hypothetical protein